MVMGVSRIVLVRGGVIFGAVAGFVAVRWGLEKLPRWRAERALRAARDGDSEREAFRAISRRSPVTFVVYDSAGASVDMQAVDWPSSARTVRFFQYGDPPIEHVLIDGKNVFALMGE